MRWMMLSAAAAALLLSGCASVPDAKSDVDFAKIARIESAARAVGVTVYWVNLPVKATTALN